MSGVGNAYSDEILLAAKLSPMLLTSKLTPEQIENLHAHTIGILTKWRDALIAESGDKFPEKVTAFRDGMAAHGRYGKPCPACGTPIQRIHTPITKRITARRARPEESCSRIAASRACSKVIGRNRSKTWSVGRKDSGDRKVGQ